MNQIGTMSQNNANQNQYATTVAQDQQATNAANNQIQTIQVQENADNGKAQQDQFTINQELQTSQFTTIQTETMNKQKAAHKGAQALAQYMGS
jgi:hypothetical protein